MKPILYSNPFSYYSMIARLVLSEKKVEYQLNHVDIHIKMEQFLPEYVTIQPNMTVPALVWGDEVFSDSYNILFFVNKNFPGVDLFPENDQVEIQKAIDRNYKFSIEGLTMGTAIRRSPFARIALKRGISRGVRRCRQLMLKHPELKNVCEKKILIESERQRLIISKSNNYNELYQNVIEICDWMDKSLESRQFIASDNYSIADVVWTVFMGRLNMIKFDDLIKKRKNLNSYWQRMSNRESFKEANICTKMPVLNIFRIACASMFRA